MSGKFESINEFCLVFFLSFESRPLSFLFVPVSIGRTYSSVDGEVSRCLSLELERQLLQCNRAHALGSGTVGTNEDRSLQAFVLSPPLIAGTKYHTWLVSSIECSILFWQGFWLVGARSPQKSSHFKNRRRKNVNK